LSLEIPIKFINSFQERLFFETKRNQCGSGGYGNGKTAGASLKVLALLAKFPRYRVAFLRKSSTDLRRTTMDTFFKFCPPGLYDPKLGGARVDSRNYLRLINGSEVFWLHLDEGAENVVRGLEINTAVVDQAEEISENIYLHLDARVGRWDKAEVPEDLNPADFPRDEIGRPIIPSYMILLCNPDSELHWIYRYYHPDSAEHHSLQEDEKGRTYRFSDTHVMLQASSIENPALSKEIIRSMLRRDKTWVDRFVHGKWGIPEGQIHRLEPVSILDDCPSDLYSEIITRGTLYRTFDHGSASPSCCLWFSSYKDWHFLYREYYQGETLISEHRRNISALSQFNGRAEKYVGNFADPDIFKKKSEKYGSTWCVADDYVDVRGHLENVPPLFWNPADNNEFLTRSRIDEMLVPSDDVAHPITGQKPAPRFYFIKKSDAFPNGAFFSVQQLRSQKRKQVAVLNGRQIFSDEREKGIPDHAYDPIRYYFGVKPEYRKEAVKRETRGTFKEALKLIRKPYGQGVRMGEFVNHAINFPL